MSATRMDPRAQMATRFAQSIVNLLSLIRQELQRLRELQEGADRWNFIGAGTLAGGALVGTAPIVILEANPKRTGLTVENIGATGVISVGIGQRSPQINTGITLLPNGGSWDGRLSGRVCQQAITLIGSQAGCQFTFVEAM